MGQSITIFSILRINYNLSIFYLRIPIFIINFQAQKKGEIDSNLKGVGLGDSWISPIDSVLTWAPFLLETVIKISFNYYVFQLLLCIHSHMQYFFTRI